MIELDKINKRAVIRTFQDLWWRGEMLKAQDFINTSIPLAIWDDLDIKKIREDCNNRMEEIKKWNDSGHPDQEQYAEIYDINTFPKYLKAIDIIKESDYQYVLDVGCYTGGLTKKLAELGYKCVGVDIHKGLMKDMNEKSGGNPMYLYGRIEEIDKTFLVNEFDVIILFDVVEHMLDLAPLYKVDKVLKKGGLVMINLPKTDINYVDEALEHMRMFDEKLIIDTWGDRKNFKLDSSINELGSDTWFITYNK